MESAEPVVSADPAVYEAPEAPSVTSAPVQAADAAPAQPIYAAAQPAYAQPIYGEQPKKKSRKWSNSYHTMVLLGLTDTGKVIVADPANRSSKTFGTMGRLKYVDFEEVLPYMFSCTSGKKYNYFSNGATAGGYILIDQ